MEMPPSSRGGHRLPFPARLGRSFHARFRNAAPRGAVSGAFETRGEFVLPPQPLARAVKPQAGHRVDDLMSLHFVSSVRWRRLS